MKQRNAKITKLFVLASATACFALAGCSSDNGNVAETEIAEAETDEEAETAEETVEATEEPTPEPTATQIPRPISAALGRSIRWNADGSIMAAWTASAYADGEYEYSPAWAFIENGVLTRTGTLGIL